MAIPIGILVLLGSFIPIVGAVVTGAVAVVLALIFLTPVHALIMLGVVLLVQQIEGHILQPLIMGTAVKVHPLAVVLVVAAGSLLAGIPGALFAVPIAAVLNVMVGYISRGTWRSNAPPPEPDGGAALWRTVPQPPPRFRVRTGARPASAAAESPSSLPRTTPNSTPNSTAESAPHD
jgi:predicted PurR-regulated permease PerM